MSHLCRTRSDKFDFQLDNLNPYFHHRFGPPEKAEKSAGPSRLPPLTNIIRKTSIVICMCVLLGGLLWCMMRTISSIHRWRPPSGSGTDPSNWPVVKAYLLLGAEITLFVIVTVFACMIPSLIMTWITAVVLYYLFGIRWGSKRHERLIRNASDLAKEMSWSTLKSAVLEGNLVVAAFFTLCLFLPWVLGTSKWVAGNSFD